LGMLGTPLHVGANRRRGGVQDGDAVALDDLPPAAAVGEVGRALVHDRGGAVAERAVHDVAVAGDPSHVGRTPVDVPLRLQVEDVTVGGRHAHQVAGG